MKVLVKDHPQQFQDSKCHPCIRVVLYVGYAIGIFPWASSLEKPGSYWKRIPSLCILAGGLAALFSGFAMDDRFLDATEHIVGRLNLILFATVTAFLLTTTLLSGLFVKGSLLFLPSNGVNRPTRDILISIPPILCFLLKIWTLVEFSWKNGIIVVLSHNLHKDLIVLTLTLCLPLCLLQYADMYDAMSAESSKDDEVFLTIQRKVQSFRTNFQWLIFALSILCCVITFGYLYFLVAKVREGQMTSYLAAALLVKTSQEPVALLYLNASAEYLRERFHAALDRFVYNDKESSTREQSYQRFLLEKYVPTVDIWGFFTLGSGTLATFLMSIMTFLVIMVQLLQGEEAGSK